jgi:hypothetical protein
VPVTVSAGTPHTEKIFITEDFQIRGFHVTVFPYNAGTKKE